MDGAGAFPSQLQAALDWAARGFRVFPLRAYTKKPRYEGWTDAATRSEAQIRAWWAENPHFNVGVLTDDMIVVDLDMKKGKNGLASMLNILDDYDELETLTVKTPSGGLHAYYSGPNRHLSAGRLGDGIDIRSYHGYVVAPGSYIDERYDDTAGCSGWYVVERDLPVRPVPREILSRLDVPIERATAVAVELDRPAVVEDMTRFLQVEAPPAIEGQGGDLTTFKVAAWCKDQGLSEETAAALMAEHYNPRCFPPWDLDELRQKVRNAFEYGARAPGGASPEAGFAGAVIPPVERPSAAWFRHGDSWDINQPWLYYELLPAGGVVALTAPSQAGKTFLLLELARSLATGKPFFDVAPDECGGTIFLFAGSEGTDFERRLAALGEDEPLPISATRVAALGEGGNIRMLAEQIREEAARMQERFGVPLRMVILETLSASGLIEDEDSNAQCAQAINLLAELGRAVGAPIVFSHHPPKGGSGARGGGALINNADYHLEVVRSGTETVRTLYLQKARGASQRRLGVFSLLDVELGTDARGRKVKSLRLSTGTSADTTAPKKAQSDLLVECIDLACVDNGFEVDGVEAAPFEDVHRWFKDRKPGSKDSGNMSKAWKASLEFAVYCGAVEDFVHSGQRYLRKREIV